MNRHDTDTPGTEPCCISAPVRARFVTKAEDWLYSSAVDYNGGKGLLEIIQLNALIL